MTYKVDQETGEITEFHWQDRLTKDGSEVPDPTPPAIPARMRQPEKLQDTIKRLIRSNQLDVDYDQAETWEEANDFEVDDDMDPASPFEEFFDPDLGRGVTPAEVQAHERQLRQEFLQAQRKYFAAQDALRVRRRVERGEGGGQPPSSTTEAKTGNEKVGSSTTPPPAKQS